MEPHNRKKLLLLARKVLEQELLGINGNLEQYNIEPFQQKNGVFVTLLKNGNLRGCIGRIEADLPLYKNIIDLSKAAAFNDHRFEKLTAGELEEIMIEISILSVPKAVEGISSFEKIMKIKPKKDGVVLSADGRKATFLPQVWESIPVREDFVSDLCRKAGLSRDYWKRNPINLSTYQVEFFKEGKEI
ncbi:MAG: AmmeMemoRadiSam system protein A [bacterium]